MDIFNSNINLWGPEKGLVEAWFVSYTALQDTVASMQNAVSHINQLHVVSNPALGDLNSHIKVYDKSFWAYDIYKGNCDRIVVLLDNSKNLCASRVLPQIPPKVWM